MSQLITVLLLIRDYYELKHKVRVFNSVIRFFFPDPVTFLLKFSFLPNKKHEFFDLKRHNSFYNENNRKATLLVSDHLFLSCNKKI